MNSLLISGISGKVGKVLTQISKSYNFNVVCGIDKKQFSNVDCPIYTTFNEVKENVDIIIDFSSDSLAEEAIKFANERNCALLCGTTALKNSTLEKLKKLSKHSPVCYSSNFSKSINLLVEYLTNLKNNLPEFNCVIIEEHSKTKVDAPSGTAKLIAQKTGITDILSVRGGNNAGVHKIIFMGEDEEIEIIHRSYNRALFAKGALICANKLLNKKQGFYTANQLLNE